MKISKIQTSPAVRFTGEKDSYKNLNIMNTKAGRYAESFVKNAAESAPVFLGMTAIWASYDKTALKTTYKNAFYNNFKKFFLPMMVVSSAFLSYIDNKSNKKE